jgi:hypothetical protein
MKLQNTELGVFHKIAGISINLLKLASRLFLALAASYIPLIINKDPKTNTHFKKSKK